MIMIIYFVLLSLPYTLSCMENNVIASARSHFEKTMPPISYFPYQIDPKLDEWRKQLNLAEEIKKENPHFKCVDIIRYSDSYRCFQYAIEHITDCTRYIPFPSQDALSIQLRCFFKQKHSIKKGNLIVYTCDEKNLTIKHFAVAISSERAQSKCGSYPEIIEHALGAVFPEYGKVFWSLALKKKYQNDKNLLLHDIDRQLQKVHECYNSIRLLTRNNSNKKTQKKRAFYKKKESKKIVL